jgi:hypothetical protein
LCVKAAVKGGIKEKVRSNTYIIENEITKKTSCFNRRHLKKLVKRDGKFEISSGSGSSDEEEDNLRGRTQDGEFRGDNEQKAHGEGVLQGDAGGKEDSGVDGPWGETEHCGVQTGVPEAPGGHSESCELKLVKPAYESNVSIRLHDRHKLKRPSWI